MSVGTGIAIAGIWLGAALLAKRSKDDQPLIAVFATVATIVVAIFSN